MHICQYVCVPFEYTFACICTQLCNLLYLSYINKKNDIAFSIISYHMERVFIILIGVLTTILFFCGYLSYFKPWPISLYPKFKHKLEYIYYKQLFQKLFSEAFQFDCSNWALRLSYINTFFSLFSTLIIKFPWEKWAVLSTSFLQPPFGWLPSACACNGP